MKWGFNWALGPFETWDALGVARVAGRLEAEGEQVPEIVKALVADGNTSFYSESKNEVTCYDPLSCQSAPVRSNPSALILKDIKRNKGVVKLGKDSSMVDLGDGVACLEFHSRNDVAGEDLAEMIRFSVEDVEKNWAGLVIGHQGQEFLCRRKPEALSPPD